MQVCGKRISVPHEPDDCTTRPTGPSKAGTDRYLCATADHRQFYLKKYSVLKLFEMRNYVISKHGNQLPI